MPRSSRSFTTAPHTHAKGRIAESTATRWLRRHGYQILETNYTIRSAEIDVIAVEPDPLDPSAPGTLCFVEIKARRTAHFGPAVTAVTPHKQRRIAQAAAAYLARSAWPGPCRFDVLGMDLTEEGWRFNLVRDAFAAHA